MGLISRSVKQVEVIVVPMKSVHLLRMQSIATRNNAAASMYAALADSKSGTE